MKVRTGEADDTVVPGHNLDDIVRIRPADVVVTLPGTHLVLFHHPQAAADANAAFMVGSGRSGPIRCAD